jgi:hypothetical protein
MEGERRAHAVAASLVVAFGLVGSRWGSHIGVGPAYITDLLLGLALLHSLLGRVSPSAEVSSRTATTRPRVGQPMLVLLLAYCFIRFAAGHHFDTVALRDFAPYAYCLVGLLSAASVARATARDRSRTTKWIWTALYAHAAWCAVAVLRPQVVDRMPSVGGLHVFSLRNDFDGAVLAILGGLAFIRWAHGRGFAYLLVVGGAGFLTVSMTSRAALLAFATAILFSTMAVWRGAASAKSRWRLILVPVAGALVAVVLPTTFAGSRLIATFGDSTAEARYQGQHVASATGTTTARKKAWRDLSSWITTDQSRLLVGVGFGPDFLAESGANVDLLGESVAAQDTVRSPHEYFLGSWARLGLLGLLPLLAVCLGALRRAWRFVPDRDELELIASLLATTLLVVASVGVVLESPFGAVPFFWAVGILAADHHRRRQELPALAAVAQSPGHGVPASG